MAARAPIIAGKTVILLQVQDTVDSALLGVKRKLNKFSASISNIGIDLFRGGLVGSLGLGFILKDFKDFEDRILFLSTKLEATDSQFASLTETIRRLGRETSYTANEVADGATSLAQAGFNAKEVSNSLGAVLDLARGGQIELADSAAILANTLTVFSLSTERASEVASQFIVAARKGTLNVLDLKESLKEVVGTLNLLNIDLPTSLALVTQLAQSSLRGTKAGTSLNTALLQLARNQDVLKNSLGIDTVDARGNLLPFINILDKLLEKLEPLGNARRVAVLQRLFNIRGGRAITGLLRDLGRTRDLAKDIKNAGNEARIAAEKMDSGFGGAIRFATSALQDLSLEIGKIVSGPLTKLLRTVPPLANAFQQILQSNPELVLSLAAIPPAALAAGVGLLSLGFVLNKLGSLIGLVGAGFGSLASILNRAFTGPLVAGLRTIGAIRSAAGRIDTAIASRVLGPTDPARIIAAQKRVARAQTALRKAQLSNSYTLEIAATKKLAAAQGRLRKAQSAGSFLGRIGQTRLSSGSTKTAQLGVAAGKLVASGFAKGFSSFSKLNAGVGSSLGFVAQNVFDVQSILEEYNDEIATNKTLLQQQGATVDASKAKLRTLNAQYEASVKAQRLANAESKKYTKAAEDSIAALDRQTNLQNRLAKVEAEYTKIASTSAFERRNELIKEAQKTRALRVAALEKERKEISNRLTKANAEFDDLVNNPPKGKRTKAFKALEKARFDRVAQIAAQREAIKLELKTLSQVITREATGPLNVPSDVSIDKGVKARKARLAVLGAERKAVKEQLALSLRDQPDVEGLARKGELSKAQALNEKEYRKQLAARIRAESAAIKNTRTAAATTAKNLRSAQKARQGFALGIKGNLFSSIAGGARGAAARTFTTLGSTLKSLSSGALKLFVTGFQLLPKLFDATITGAFKLIVAVKNLSIGFLKLGGIAFRTLTTLSGWGNIITFLLIFGDKIEFIRNGLARLGTGFGNAFSAIFGTFKDAAGTFSLFGEGIGSLLRGDGAIGISQLSESISLLGTIIKSNLVIAFNEIKIAVAPAFDFIYKGISSIIELFKLLGSLVGITFSNIGSGINSLSGGGAGSLTGGILAAIKQAFSPESIKAGFQFIGAVFTELAKSINSIFETMFQVFNTTMSAISRGVEGLFNVILKLTLGIANALPNNGYFKNIQLALFDAAAFAIEPARNAARDSANRQGEAGREIENAFQSTPQRIDGVLGKFLAALDNIFKINTEEAAIAAKAAAEAAKKNAQDLAQAGLAVAGNIASADPNNPFVLLGRGIFELNSNLRGLLTGLTSSSTTTAAPTNALDSLKALFQTAKDNLAPPTTQSIVRDLQAQNALAQRQLVNRRNEFGAAQQGELGELLRNPRGIFGINDRLAGQREIFKDFAEKTNIDIQARNQQIRDLLRGTPQAQQADDLANIVSSVSGSIQATRLNKFGFGQAENNPTDLLKTISTQLGPGPSTDSYLKQLVDKAGPLAFAK